MSLPPEFWEARKALGVTREVARSLRVSPESVLAVSLARVITQVPPEIMLPPLVGSPASLNLFVAVVGRSGLGKGAAMGAAAAASPFGDVDPVRVESPGSGEGIAHLFMRRTGKTVEQHAESVLLDVAEIDSYAALTARQGATLGPETRKLWSGERLGFAYVDPAKRLPVPAHRYRACMVAGVQPRRAGALLNDADGGTPQRFIWADTADPGAPDDRPATPDVELWRAPGMQFALNQRQPDAARRRIHLEVDYRVIAVLDAVRLRALRGDQTEVDPLDGHRGLAQLKVAAALALWDGRAEVTWTDWDLGATVMAESDRVRTGVVEHLADAHAQANKARGRSDADRAVLTADALENRRLHRTQRRCLRHVELHDDAAHCTRRCFILMLGPTTRDLIEPALDQLVEAGELVETITTTGIKGWALP